MRSAAEDRLRGQLPFVRLRELSTASTFLWIKGNCPLHATFPVATPAFASGHCLENAPFREGGKRGARPSLSKLNTWRDFRAPPACLPDR
jgi:hypothetical protein